MKSLETAFDFISLQNTWNQDTHFMTQSIWLPLKSLSDPVTIAKHHHSYQILEQGRPEQGLPTQSNDMDSFSVSVCLYWPEIFCLQSIVLSAHMYVMVFQDKHILTKWNILSNCFLVYSRERIFHFGRVCLFWKTITYIQAERTRLWTQNISGQYRHTYKQRECHSYTQCHPLQQ